MEEKTVKVQNSGGAENKGTGGQAVSAATLPRQLTAVQPVAEKACPVCGHINKAQSLLCEMCSNYLID